MTVTREQFFNFVKENNGEEYEDPKTWIYATKYYLKLWERNNDNHFFLTLNWSGFFLNYFWLAYRKMYLFTFIYAVFNLGSNFVLKNIFLQDSTLSTPILFLGVVFECCLFFIPGIFANFLYFYHVKNCILQGKLKRGGTSLWGVFLAILIPLLVNLLFLKTESLGEVTHF